MDSDTDESPSVRRGERFTAEETNVLVREVRARKHLIYGTNASVPKIQEVRKTWDEIAKIVSAIEGITRTGAKCRKRYNDVKRRGNRKMAAGKSSPSASKPDEEPEYGGLEIGVHAAEKEPMKPESEEDSKATEQTAALDHRTNYANVLQPGDQPYLDLQQNGFNMLESELEGVRQVIASLHSRLSNLEGLLRPMELISTSLRRIAIAVERFPPQ